MGQTARRTDGRRQTDNIIYEMVYSCSFKSRRKGQLNLSHGTQ